VPQKRKAVFTADPRQLERIDALVRAGRYRSASEFLREAIDEKLHALAGQRLKEEVARYCAEGYGDEDRALVDMQAFDEEP
jgi:Arc/MetJ-type ribon-helix-helix transcriptional regulator